MKVKDVMTQKVLTCAPEEPLSEAARIMWDGDCGFVPVVDVLSGQLCGVVTDRDACMASYHQGRALADIPVHIAMSRATYTCREDDDLEQAEEAMTSHGVRRLPVLDARERLVGVVSLHDLARRALQEKAPQLREDVAQTLGRICQQRAHVLA